MAARKKTIARAFGAKLKAAREATGLLRESLGSRCKPPMTRESVARLEAGERMPGIDTLMRLARALGVPAAELLPDQVG